MGRVRVADPRREDVKDGPELRRLDQAAGQRLGLAGPLHQRGVAIGDALELEPDDLRRAPLLARVFAIPKRDEDLAVIGNVGAHEGIRPVPVPIGCPLGAGPGPGQLEGPVGPTEKLPELGQRGGRLEIPLIVGPGHGQGDDQADAAVEGDPGNQPIRPLGQGREQDQRRGRVALRSSSKMARTRVSSAS